MTSTCPERGPTRRAALVALAAATTMMIPGAAGALTPSPMYRRLVIDGHVIRRFPCSLGDEVETTHEFDDVRFVSRIWEEQIRGGWRVDVRASVLRGRPLRSSTDLRRWFVAYQERPLEEAGVRGVALAGRRVWLGHDQAFWLTRPGVAVAVTVDRRAHPRSELIAAATSTLEVRARRTS